METPLESDAGPKATAAVAVNIHAAHRIRGMVETLEKLRQVVRKMRSAEQSKLLCDETIFAKALESIGSLFAPLVAHRAMLGDAEVPAGTYDGVIYYARDRNFGDSYPPRGKRQIELTIVLDGKMNDPRKVPSVFAIADEEEHLPMLTSQEIDTLLYRRVRVGLKKFHWVTREHDRGYLDVRSLVFLS